MSAFTVQISQEGRLISEQPHPLLLDRRQRQVHATHEPGSNIDSILSSSNLASVPAGDGSPEHVDRKQPL